MEEITVRVAWRPRAWAWTATHHPELAAGGRQPWLDAAVARHVERGARSRSVLAAALRADGLLDDGAPTVTEHRLPASLVEALDPEARSAFVQEAALVAVEAER